MNSSKRHSWRDDFFAKMLERPITVILLAAAIIVAVGAGVPHIQKDPSVDAFVSSNHPVAATRDRAKDLFGLEDPIIVGFAAPRGESVYTPEALDAFRSFEKSVRQLPNVQKQRLVSVLHESAIMGSDGDLETPPILEPGRITIDTARLAHERLLSMPMMVDLLGSEVGDIVTMVVPVDDPNNATETYAQIKQLADDTARDIPNLDVHVAGVAAMNGRLAHMVDSDTKRLIPLAILTALIVIFIALRRWNGVVGPLFVIAGSAAIAVGCMGWMGSRYYLITTALPVIIMAISIADSLHISIAFMRERELDPQGTAKSALLKALSHVSTPVTLTTVTTIAGFAGLALGTSMVPIREFGIYAALGVFAAWGLSLTLLPCVILLSRLSSDTAASSSSVRWLDRWISKITKTAFNRPVPYAFALCTTLVSFAVMSSHAKFDYERKLYFPQTDFVRMADIEINDRLAGVNFLDVVVSSQDEGGLLTPAALQDLTQLQNGLSKLSHVEKVSGIVDYISLMHEALVGEADALPTKSNAGAQYMFLYEASGDPGDFEEEIDYTQTHTLIRAQLKIDQYSALSGTIDEANQLLGTWGAQSGLTAAISGRVAVNDSWMDELANSHFKGLGLAVLLVFIATILTFRSVTAAILTLVPVLTGVLFTYAIMGLTGISIAPATSMTAAIATGLGVDFAIHLISEIRHARSNGLSGSYAFTGNYVVVARACIFSALALGIGLAVICISIAPPLRWFGGLVASAALGSLVGAVLVLPALFSILDRFQHTSQLKEATT